ncbi:MAG: hypothetical protein KGL93_12855 [Gemmatimonadota bacterium]|nr:hypothetical protein [Gemmatimonadota bacterium]HEU4989311.1 hypothetical protein [Gemmatimonadaceae bacterium]
MSHVETEIDQVLEALVRDVVAEVHAMYRGEVRQQTAKLKTAEQRATARAALLKLVGVLPPAPDGTDPDPVAVSALAPDEVAAVTRCILGWLPMGDSRTAVADSRCIPAAREIAPTWGEREKARLALRRAAEH